MFRVPTQNLYLGPLMAEIHILVGWFFGWFPCHKIFLVVNLTPALDLEPIKSPKKSNSINNNNNLNDKT